MANILYSWNLNRILISFTLTSFVLTYAVNLPAVEFPIGLNEAAFMVRIKKLVDKLKDSEKKGVDRIIDALIDIKIEIEASYNTTLDINYYFDQLGSELKKQGIKPPKKEFDVIKKKLKKADKKHKHHLHYFGTMMHEGNYQFTLEDEVMLYEAKRGKHRHDKKKDEEKVEVPAHLVYGVSLALCGLFLYVIPPLRPLGQTMITMGITACANCINNKIEDDKKKDKEKK